jgi:uncharacterized protein
VSSFEAGLDGVTFNSHGCKLLGGFYRGAGVGPRPTAVLLHGMPGVEKHLDLAYALRDLGWNCLYFHFRGSWGSEGSYSLDGLADDTRAAVSWVLDQSSVDSKRLALIGGSVGGHTALACGAGDSRIQAIVGIAPLVDPPAFTLSEEMAGEFAGMLNGVTTQDLLEQWRGVPRLVEYLPSLTSRSVLMVTAGNDTLFPSSHYAEVMARLANARWARAEGADHGFSTCRSWLVDTVTDWLVATLGR